MACGRGDLHVGLKPVGVVHGGHEQLRVRWVRVLVLPRRFDRVEVIRDRFDDATPLELLRDDTKRLVDVLVGVSNHEHAELNLRARGHTKAKPAEPETKTTPPAAPEPKPKRVESEAVPKRKAAPSNKAEPPAKRPCVAQITFTVPITRFAEASAAMAPYAV